MSKVSLKPRTMVGIADAIRSRTGKTEAMYPNQMANEIKSINAEGSDWDSPIGQLIDRYIVDLELPEGLDVIGERAFYGCKAMKTVTFPSTLTEIEAEAFNGCTNLSGIDLSKCTELTSIGENAFLSCTSSTGTVNLSNTKLSSIPNSTFKNCTITAVTFPKTITSIGNSAFDNCKNITGSIDLSGSELNSIGERAFYGCSLLTSVDLSDTKLVSLPVNAFYNCPVLEVIKLPISLETIDKTTFYRAIPKTLNIPPRMTIPSNFLGNSGNAANNTSLVSLTSSYDQDVSSLEPGGSISSQAFYYCQSLETVDLYNTRLISIASGAFQYCTALTTVSLPSTIDNIGTTAFSNCTKLKTINVPWADGKVGGAPWGATNANVNYNYKG